MEFPPRNKGVGGWVEGSKQKRKERQSYSKQTRGQTSVEMRQMHMPNVIIYWPTENLPVTMIIYNLIKRT